MRAALALLLTLTTSGSSYAASLGPSRCEAAKLVAAAGAALRIAKCHAAAARLGAAVDPSCVDAARGRLSTAFGRAETRPCISIGEATDVAAELSVLGVDLTSIVGGGPSRCDGGKLLAAGKYLQSALKAEAAHAMAPERGRLMSALGKASDTLMKKVEAAEAAVGCTGTAGATTIAARAGAGADDLVDLVRGTLRGVAARSGRTIGAAVRANVLVGSDAAYRTTLLRQVGAVTAEYEFMWGNMEPAPGTYVWGPIDTIVAFTEAHGLPLKGAPLVWHLILPPWIDDGMTAAELQTAVDQRIDLLMGTYAGKVTTWDVVNEAVVDFGAAFRDSIFLRKLGPDYIRNAFLRARQADPNALLFYNDFLADGLNVKSDFIYDMIVGLLAQGTPIDGVSFQMHLGGGFGSVPTRESVRQNLQRFADLGLVVRISEMDVQVHDLLGEAADQSAQQRTIYHDMVAACVDVAACDSVSFWGISDRYTWVKDYLGILDRPLPFDLFYRPKGAFFGVRDALLGY